MFDSVAFLVNAIFDRDHIFRLSSLSPNARMARIASLENMLSISSNSLVAMASQLSEAEERERGFSNRGRWNQLRSMGDAKGLLQYMFNSLADTRCVSLLIVLKIDLYWYFLFSNPVHLSHVQNVLEIT